MREKVKYFGLNFLILGWGFGALYWGIFGDLEKLLNPFFQPILICAGIVFIGMGVVRTDFATAEGCSHLQNISYGHIGLGISVLGVVLLCRPDQLTLKTILNRDSKISVIDLSRQKSKIDFFASKLIKSEIIELDLMDLFYIAKEENLRLKIKGKTISLLGQVVSKRGYSLMRILVWCCASDARPIMVQMKDLIGRDFHEGDWMVVQGTLAFEIEEGAFIPVIHFQQSKRVPAPEEIYLY